MTQGGIAGLVCDGANLGDVMFVFLRLKRNTGIWPLRVGVLQYIQHDRAKLLHPRSAWLQALLQSLHNTGAKMQFVSHCHMFSINDVEPSKVVDWDSFVIRRKWVTHGDRCEHAVVALIGQVVVSMVPVARVRPQEQ